MYIYNIYSISDKFTSTLIKHEINLANVNFYQ